MTHEMRIFAKLAASFLCLTYLAGCLPNTLEAGLTPADLYPFKADSRLVTQPIVFAAGKTTLENDEKNSLNAFVKHYFERGGGMLEIRQTTAGGNKRAEARPQALRRHILRQGVRPSELSLRRVAGADDAGGPIIVSFASFTLRTVPCTQRNRPTANNPTNKRHPDFGCTLRNGLASIIANPADLEAPQPELPGDGRRRARVHRNYSAGEPTEANRGRNEATGSIRNLGGG